MGSRNRGSGKDTAIGLAVIFGWIAFFIVCAVQGWDPGFIMREALAVPLVVIMLMTPIAFVLLGVAVLIGRRS